ncbi:hypothetical protein LV779_16060 [Streptomyces thinghirensis]|nr:hypothetical protein [Streptomyces thinghirensis]
MRHRRCLLPPRHHLLQLPHTALFWGAGRRRRRRGARDAAPPPRGLTVTATTGSTASLSADRRHRSGLVRRHSATAPRWRPRRRPPTPTPA